MDVLEREEQLGALGACLDRARLGAGSLVWVEGEAGVGKTTVVHRFSEGVRGARVVIGTCDPLATPRPLAPVLDIAERLGAARSRVRTEGSADEPTRQQLFDLLLDELASRSWVTVAVIEDVHWADEATLDLLRYVGRRIHALRGLLVVTSRDDEVGPQHPLRRVRGDLATSAGLVRIHLEPLSPQAVSHLVAERGLAGRVDPRSLHTLTGGNPFYVTEVLAAPDRGVPETVRDAVLARASRLPAAGSTVLEAAAVVPTRVETWLLERITDVDDRALDVCVAAGVLRPAGPGLVAFRHELARQAIDASIPPARRARLHARVTDALLERQDLGIDPARIASHAEQAGERGLARRFAIAAAEQATRLGAHREAAAQYERALRHVDGLADAELAALLEASALAAARVDRTDAAARAAEEALRLRRRVGEPVTVGRALRLRARTLWDRGHSAAAAAMAQEAIHTLEALPEGQELADAYATAASFAMLARDPAAAQARGEQAIRLAERVGADQTLAHALGIVGASRLVAGDAGGAQDLRRSIAIAEAAELPDLVSLGWLNLGSGSGEVRDYPTAVEALREAIAYTAARDLDHRRHYAEAWLARVELERGHWDAASRLIRRLNLDDSRIATPSRIVALGVLARLRTRRGDGDATGVLEEAWALAKRTGDLQRLWPVAAARAEAAWLRDQPDAIPACVDATYALACELGLAWAIGELGLWRRRAGCIDALPAAAAEPWALHAAGRLRDAARAWQQLGAPYEAADALADSERPADLLEALRIFDELGAVVAGTRVRRRLRALGVRGVPRGPRRATVTHPAGLTPRQAEVLNLVARGLSDADIARHLHLSPKTVGHHVSAVLAKLEVSSRGEAAHRARELADAPGDAYAGDAHVPDLPGGHGS